MGRIRYGARTLEELVNREVKATSVGAWATSLVAVYETDPDAIAAVLPPPLEPSDRPLVRVNVATVDLGRGLPPFGAGTFAVQARHEGTVGNYPLVMPMTTEQSVIGGRETFGEPKKIGAVSIAVDGDAVTARIERMGFTLATVTGRLGAAIDVAPKDKVDFYFKCSPSPDGKGFDTEPALVYCRRHEEARDARAIDGTLTLGESPLDPIADIPVGAIRSFEFAQVATVQTGEVVERVPADWLLPYVHQRFDDLSVLGKKR